MLYMRVVGRARFSFIVKFHFVSGRTGRGRVVFMRLLHNLHYYYSLALLGFGGQYENHRKYTYRIAPASVSIQIWLAGSAPLKLTTRSYAVMPLPCAE